MTSISKNVYIDKQEDIVNKCNYTYHSTIKQKPVEAKPNTYIDFNKKNEGHAKREVGDHVRVSKYKNIFAKVYLSNWSEEVYMIKTVKNTAPWTYVISDLIGEVIVGRFYEKELQKTNQKEFRVEKVIK